MKCFYHAADLDGHCSGAIVKLKHPECELIQSDYDYGRPCQNVQPGEIVYMVDFSLQPFDQMIRLRKSCGQLIWIDHHKTAIDAHAQAVHGGEKPLPGLREIGQAGCELTWRYCFPNRETPRAVYLLGRYDVWDHSDPAVLPFQYGMRSNRTDPADKGSGLLWDSLLGVYGRDREAVVIEEAIKAGCNILEYIRHDNRKYTESTCFPVELEGLRCIAVNRMFGSSQLFESVYDPDMHDAMLAFGYRNHGWVVTLYTTHAGVDVSRVAKKYGGGGHAQAAGFPCRELPFDL